MLRSKISANFKTIFLLTNIFKTDITVKFQEMSLQSFKMRALHNS